MACLSVIFVSDLSDHFYSMNISYHLRKLLPHEGYKFVTIYNPMSN